MHREPLGVHFFHVELSGAWLDSLGEGRL
jgi:hypothetical protein